MYVTTPSPVFLALDCLSCQYASHPSMDISAPATRGFSHGSGLETSLVCTCIGNRRMRDRSCNFVKRKYMLVRSRNGTGIPVGRCTSEQSAKQHKCVVSGEWEIRDVHTWYSTDSESSWLSYTHLSVCGYPCLARSRTDA